MTYEEQKKKLEEIKLRNQEEYKKTRDAFRFIAKDPNAQIVFRHLAKICGFFQSSVVIDHATHEISTQSVIFNEGRRAVYLDLRRMMTDEIRRLIESKGEDDARRPEPNTTDNGNSIKT